MRMKLILASVFILLAFAGTSLFGAFYHFSAASSSRETAFPEQGLVEAIQLFEIRQVGYRHSTANFKRFDGNVQAYNLCYVAGKFELPDSYWKLKRVDYDASAGRCSANEADYDIYFQPAEAIARIRTPVTASMSAAPLWRFLTLVFHEDFHEQVNLKYGVAQRVQEAAALFVEIHAGMKFARWYYGEASFVYQYLVWYKNYSEGEARILDAYAERLRILYASVEKGAIRPDEALTAKAELFEAMQSECRAVLLAECIGGDRDNAHLAKDLTYTSMYPLMLELYEAQGRDLAETVDTLITLARLGPSDETEFVRSIRTVIERHTSK